MRNGGTYIFGRNNGWVVAWVSIGRSWPPSEQVMVARSTLTWTNCVIIQDPLLTYIILLIVQPVYVISDTLCITGDISPLNHAPWPGKYSDVVCIITDCALGHGRNKLRLIVSHVHPAWPLCYLVKFPVPPMPLFNAFNLYAYEPMIYIIH